MIKLSKLKLISLHSGQTGLTTLVEGSFCMSVTQFYINVEVHRLEAVWVELQVNSKRILVGGLYKPPTVI